MKMTKFHIIKLIDLFSFIGLASLISTGALMKFTLPPRSGAMSIWGLTRHDWGTIHYYIALIFLILISIHLLLHLGFIKAAILGKVSREVKYRLSIGIVGFIVLLLLLSAPFFSPIHNENTPGFGRQNQNQ